MTDRFLIAGLAALGLGALLPLPVLAIDDPHPSPLASQVRADKVYPEAPRLAPRLAPDPRRRQIADGVQSSDGSSVRVTGGQTDKCAALAGAYAKANDVEDSHRDLKVVDGDGCSAKAESSATTRPRRHQSE